MISLLVSGQRADNVTVYRSEEETHYCSIGNIEVQCREAGKLEKDKPRDDYANTSHTASSTNVQGRKAEKRKKKWIVIFK